MKIGLANRDGIVSKLNISELKSAGVQAIELYLRPDNPSINDQIKELVDEGLEPVIHLAGDCNQENLQTFLKEAPWHLIQTVVFHPVESNETWSRNLAATEDLCHFLGQQKLRTFCLENLPYDSRVPERFGSVLGEVVSVAARSNLHNCFDTGHYFSGIANPQFTALNGVLAELIEHVHIHSYVNQEDHHPLQDDDGSLQRLIGYFRDLRPDYSGIFSIEIIPFGHSADDAVFGSIEALKQMIS